MSSAAAMSPYLGESFEGMKTPAQRHSDEKPLSPIVRNEK